MTELHFLRPLWLLALVPLLVLLIQLYRKRMRAGAWEKVCDPALVPFVIQPGKGGASPLRLTWMGLGALLKAAGLVPSSSEGLRKVEQGGVRVDGTVVSDKGLKLPPGTYVLQVGKRQFARVTLQAA